MLFRTLNKLKMSQLLCGVMLRALDLEKKKSLYSSTFAWRCLVGVGFCIYKANTLLFQSIYLNGEKHLALSVLGHRKCYRNRFEWKVEVQQHTTLIGCGVKSKFTRCLLFAKAFFMAEILNCVF